MPRHIPRSESQGIKPPQHRPSSCNPRLSGALRAASLLSVVPGMGLFGTFATMNARYINLVPLFSFFVLLAYAGYAATVVGHWPYYSSPDPSDLPATRLAAPLLWVSLLGFALVVLIPVAYVAYRILARLRKWRLHDQKSAYVWYAIGAAPWVLDLVIAYGSRYSLLSWILD